MAEPSITDLADKISREVNSISEFFAANNIPALSLLPGAPAASPVPSENVEIHTSRRNALDALKTLQSLLMTPTEKIMTNFASFHDSSTLQVLHRFKIANTVPVDGKASYAEITKTTGLQDTKLRTILRHAMTLGLFIDNGDDTVSHTATSAAIATQPFVADNLGFTTQDCFPASAKLADALEKFGDSGEPNHSAFNLAFDTQDPLFDWLAKNEVSGSRYSRVMKGMAGWEALDKKHILEGFDWELHKEGTVVDVGGSYGQASFPLAKAFPDLKLIVQDVPATIAEGKAKLPEEIQGRIEFMEHDFFKEQPVKGADVYLMRWIMHDWSDEYCIKILSQLVPAMTEQSRLLISESIMPPIGTLSSQQEKNFSISNMFMLTLHNSRERTIKDFANVFSQVDPRLRIVGHKQPAGSQLAFIEAKLCSD